MIFQAKYRGGCPDCDNPIRVGDYVTFNLYDELCHADCIAAHPQAPVTICDRCHLMTPCECDD
jgi:hypothetical protein